jgi:hypothetical protein
MVTMGISWMQRGWGIRLTIHLILGKGKGYPVIARQVQKGAVAYPEIFFGGGFNKFS